jgi:hypothetical protein
MGAFSSDTWMRTFHTQCIRGELNLKEMEKEFSKFGPIFKDAKLRVMIFWELRLMI